jgi:glycolate oxidase iron-sulfur subunit
MPALFPRTLGAWRELFGRLGVPCSVPGRQTCCGALHLQHGEFDAARVLAKRNISAFEAAGDGLILVAAAGCGAALKDYGELLADDPSCAVAARAFAARVRDVTEVLEEWIPAQPAPAGKDEPLRAVCLESCHLRHVQQVRQAPGRILDRLPGLRRLETPEVDLCCGSAGLYNLLEPEMSAQLGDRKAERLLATGAQIVVTTNPGCQLQMAGRLAAQGVEVRHILEVCAALWPRCGGPRVIDSTPGEANR